MKMQCEGNCGCVTNHENIGTDDIGDTIWQCDECGQVRGDPAWGRTNE